MELKHLNTFLQFRLLFHEPHCSLQECLDRLSLSFDSDGTVACPSLGLVLGNPQSSAF